MKNPFETIKTDCRFLSIPWHDFIFDKHVKIVIPKRGPFDPRSVEQRTGERLRYVCARCGLVSHRKDYVIYDEC